MNEAAANARNLPTGFLSVRKRQTVESALQDALFVVHKGINFLENIKLNG